MDTTQPSSTDLTPATIDGMITVIQEVFRQFRPVILERAGKSAHTNKRDGSPVTDTDMEIEVTLQGVMAQRFPGIPIYGEETGYKHDLPGVFWLVDPIDGTKSFIENVPSFTSMAVLISNREAIACLVYNPSTDDLYMAQKGKGAYKNGVRLDLAALPLPQVASCKEEFIAPLHDLLKSKAVTCEVAPSGAGYAYTLIVDGLSAARFQMHSSGQAHDYAPGSLLIREAGGAVVPIHDDGLTYESRSFVLCHPLLADTLRPHIAVLRALDVPAPA